MKPILSFLALICLLITSQLSYGSEEQDFKWGIKGGVLRGVFTCFEYPPVRVGKMMAGSSNKRTVFETVKDLHKTGGLLEFYRGGTSFFFRKGPQWLYRGLVKSTYEAYSGPLKGYPFLSAFMLGSVFGIADGVTECASDRINTVVTTVKEPKFRFKKHRPFILYRDMNNTPRTIRITRKFLFGTLDKNIYSNALAWCGFLGFWEVYKGLFSDEEGNLSTPKRALVGGLSGITSSLIVSPYHYRLIHLQGVNPFEPKGVVNDLKYLIARDGWSSLSRFTLLKMFGAGASSVFTGIFFMQ